jgi:hypothetical protein
MAVKRTIKFERITTKDFDLFFQLDSPGWYISNEAIKKAVKRGETATAKEMVEMVVLANKLCEMEYRNRVAEALMPFGKTAEYLSSADTQGAVTMPLDILGRAAPDADSEGDRRLRAARVGSPHRPE